MVWLQAMVLGRLGYQFPPKSGCSILPIVRYYGAEKRRGTPQHLRAGAMQVSENSHSRTFVHKP